MFNETQIALDKNCSNEISIYDITGKILTTQKFADSETVTWINTNDLKAGIYFIVLKCNGQKIETQKLVIE